MRFFAKNKGITLIALVITTIILILLAGISISLLTNTGLIQKTQNAKSISRYSNAKETINLKLMEIETGCYTNNKEYNIREISKKMKETDNITIEKYYNNEIASIKNGVTENLVNLTGIVVSVNDYSEYKFLIGELCQIQGVTTKEVTDTTDKSEFEDIEKFEKTMFYKNNKEETNKLLSYFDFEDENKEEKIKNDLNNENFIKSISDIKISNNIKKTGEGSCYFPGIANGNLRQDNSKLDFGTKDFTIELWTNSSEQVMPYSLLFGSYSNQNLNMFIRDEYCDGNITLVIGNTRIINTNIKYTVNKWMHYAVVRKNGVFSIYENGIKIGETDQYKNINVSMSDLSIGGNSSINNTSYKGYIDEFTIYSYAKYLSKFDIDDIRCDDADILYSSFDEYGSSMIDKITKNNIYIQDGSVYTTDKDYKIGKKSCYFSGTVGKKILQDVKKLDFGFDDFTVEFWIKPEEQINQYALLFGSYSNSNLNMFIQDAFCNGNITLAIGNTRIINTNIKYTVNKWMHYAVVRKDGVFCIYENGIKIGETDQYKNINVKMEDFAIGGNSSISDTPYKGYIDNFEVYNYAKYLSDFVPENK